MCVLSLFFFLFFFRKINVVEETWNFVPSLCILRIASQFDLGKVDQKR